MEFSGSKTEANLWAAFAGESQARVKYGYFAAKAKKEGYEQIAGIFTETSDNEKEHAELWLKYLGVSIDTQSNLQTGVDGEHYETTQMYPGFAETAREEGFTKIAAHFDLIGKIESSHENRYRLLKETVTSGNVFKRDVPTQWKCRNCGHLHTGTSAPGVCPACDHPQAYFEVANVAL